MNCPACQLPYNPGNRFCGRCGADLAAVSAEPAAPAPEPPAAPFHPYAASPDAGPSYPFAAARPGDFRRPALLYTVLRSLAYIIDALIIPVPLALLWLLLGLPVPDFSTMEEVLNPPPEFRWLQLLNFSLALVYETALITLYAATVGKRLFGMYVVRTDGSRVGWGRALARHLLKVLLANFAIITLGLVFLAIVMMIALRQDKRGLHDLICDTVVLRRDRRAG